MAAMGKLIEDGMKAGWLIATEGVQFGQAGVRVHKKAGGEITVTDGPFTEAKEVIGGYALLRASSKAEVVELCRKFLKAAGQGTCEVHELFERPAAGGPPGVLTAWAHDSANDRFGSQADIGQRPVSAKSGHSTVTISRFQVRQGNRRPLFFSSGRILGSTDSSRRSFLRILPRASCNSSNDAAFSFRVAPLIE